MKFHIKKFEDKPKYCRVPIYFGGEKQIHLIQPYDNEKCDAGPEPLNLHDWTTITKDSGQIVFSLEALEDFINALRKFADELRKN